MNNNLYIKNKKLFSDASESVKITIKEIDLYTYYLQKNYWTKGIGYDEFLEIIKSKNNIKIIF